MVFNLLCNDLKFTMTFHYSLIRKLPNNVAEYEFKSDSHSIWDHPLHPKRIGKKIKEWGCAIVASAPTQILKPLLI